MFSKFSKKSERCRTGCYLNAYELLQLNLEDITRELITYNEIQVYHKRSLRPLMNSSNFQGESSVNSPYLSHNKEKDETQSNSFHGVSIILVTKWSKETTRKKNHKPISLVNKNAKITNNFKTKFRNTLIRSCITTKWASSQRCKSGSTYVNW